MDEFLQNLKDEVSKNPKTFEKQGAWQRFTKYRSTQEKSQVRVIPTYFWWAVAAMLVLLLGSNFYWYQNQNQTYSFEQKTDTIYITKYVKEAQLKAENDLAIYINDIKQSKILLEKAEARIYALEQSFNQKYSNSIAQTDIDIKKTETSVPKNLDPRFKTTTKDLNTNKIVSSEPNMISEEAIRKLWYFSDIGDLPIDPLNARERRFNPGPLYFKFEEKPSLLDYLRPKSLSLEGSIGYIGHFKENWTYLHGPKFSLGINSLFSDHIRFSGGIALNAEFTEVYDVNNQTFIPEINLPENTSINEVYVNNLGLSIRGGFDYLFKNKNFWRPYVGLAYAKFIDLEQKYTYKLTGTFDDFYIEGENERIRNLYDFVLLRFGSDFNLSRNIDGTLGFTYLQNLRNSADIGFTISPGLYYHF